MVMLPVRVVRLKKLVFLGARSIICFQMIFVLFQITCTIFIIHCHRKHHVACKIARFRQKYYGVIKKIFIYMYI